MSRVIHFEIFADHPEAAIKFYTNVFGWIFTKYSGAPEYWLITTGPDQLSGINGGLIRRQILITGNAITAYVCTIEVSSIEHISEKVIQNGGAVISSKKELPGIGWHAYCRDNQGNQFGILERGAE